MRSSGLPGSQGVSADQAGSTWGLSVANGDGTDRFLAGGSGEGLEELADADQGLGQLFGRRGVAAADVVRAARAEDRAGDDEDPVFQQQALREGFGGEAAALDGGEGIEGAAGQRAGK